MGRVVLNLAPQPVDENAEILSLVNVLGSPYVVEECSVGDYPSGTLHEVGEDVEFTSGEFDGNASLVNNA